jgi:hypothetical protein
VSGPADAPGSDATPESDEELRRLALGYAQLFLEVESGLRPRRAVEAMMDTRLCERLADHWVRRGPLRTPAAARVVRCGPGCFEAAVAVRGRRWGALALRLELRGARWRVVEAARPEDGVLPDAAVPLPLGELCAFELVLPPRERRTAPVAPATGVIEQARPLAAAVGL